MPIVLLSIQPIFSNGSHVGDALWTLIDLRCAPPDSKHFQSARLDRWYGCEIPILIIFNPRKSRFKAFSIRASGRPVDFVRSHACQSFYFQFNQYLAMDRTSGPHVWTPCGHCQI